MLSINSLNFYQLISLGLFPAFICCASPSSPGSNAANAHAFAATSSVETLKYPVSGVAPATTAVVIPTPVKTEQSAAPSALSTWDNPTTVALYTAAKSGSQSSFQRLLAFAETGDTQAQVDVAICYEDELGVAKNPVAANEFAHKALGALVQAARHGNSVAEEKLGLLYKKGLGVARDYVQALYWYRASAAQGDSEGQRLLGVMYEFGWGVPLDKLQALAWFQKSADLGNLFSQFTIGDMYMDAEGVPRDYGQALKWFQKSADQGSTESMANLGYMYQQGYGVPQDYAHALKLYQMSANQGGLWGQRLLGQMYERGWGVPQNKAKAVMWYRKSAAQGDPLSKVKIDELGTNADLSQAAAKGDIQEVIRLLKDGVDPDALNSALWGAVYARSPEVVALLIAHGADVNEKDQFGVTPLYAAARQESEDVMETLIANGASINPKECSDAIPLFGAIPIYYSTEDKSVDVIELLIRKGASVNATDCKGMTALHVASARGLNDTAVLLVLNGADVNAKNDAGLTPFDVAPKQSYGRDYDLAAGGSDGRISKTSYRELFSPTYSNAKPSFECKRSHALTHVESEICAVPLLRALDRKLNDSYSVALKTARDPKALKDEQRAWLEDMDEKCNRQDPECSIGHLVALYDNRIAVLNLPAGDQDMAQSGKRLPGATPEERCEFLKNLMTAKDYRSTDDIANDVPYILGALMDPSPIVRESAAFWLIDESLLPRFIHVMATDPDPRVRTSAAMSISEFITNNGASDRNSVGLVSKHLDEFLLGLADQEPSFSGGDESTARYVLDVLGGRSAGNMPLPCFMSKYNQQRVINALIFYQRISSAPRGKDIEDVLRHIRSCPMHSN